jgi:hypothetical protein
MYVCMHACMYVYIYELEKHVCVCVRACVDVCIYIHKYTVCAEVPADVALEYERVTRHTYTSERMHMHRYM